jgi:hypothetical protein
MGSNSSSGKFDNGIYVFGSTDGGRTFGPPVPVYFDLSSDPNTANLIDKPYLIIDTSPTSLFKNTIYVTWVGIYPSDMPYHQGIRIAHKRSSDSQFSDQQRISHTGQITGPAIAFGPNGEIYGAWEGHGNPDTLLFNASTDGGVTFWTPIGERFETDLRIHDYFVGALDDPNLTTVSIPGVHRVNSFPSIDVDRSNSPNRGKIYIAWAEQFTSRSANSDVFLLVLPPPDGSPPPQSPPPPTRVKPSGSDQFFPFLKVDPQTGNIYIAFYDQFGGGASINPFFTSSANGGATFSTPTSLSSASSNPQVQSLITGANGEGIGIGDYIWLDVSRTKLGVVWTDTRNAKQEILFGGLSFASIGGPNPPPNDNCSSPHSITALPFSDTIDTTLATTSTGDPVTCSGNQGSNSVWYSLQATSNTVIGVDTSGSNYDTVLSVFTGACSSLSPVACNDDFGNNLGNRSMLTFQAQAGSLYLIEVTAKSAAGTLALRVGYPTVTSIQYTTGPDGNQSLQISGAGFIANNAQVIVQLDGADTILPNTFFTGQTQGDGTVSSLFANRRKLKKLIKPGIPVQVRVESPVGSGTISVPLSFTR